MGIDLKHLVANPQCDQIYPAWRVMCKRSGAAVFVEEARLEEVRTLLGRGSAQLRHAEYISQYGSVIALMSGLRWGQFVLSFPR